MCSGVEGFKQKNITASFKRHGKLRAMTETRSEIQSKMAHENYFPKMIFLDAPILLPAWLAPLLVPACKPMMDSPALNCSSVKSRLFSSDGRGPKNGPLNSGCL